MTHQLASYLLIVSCTTQFLNTASTFATAPATAPPVTAIIFSPDHNEVLLGSQDGLEVRSWPGLVFLRAMDTELTHVHDLRFSPDGMRWVTAAGDGICSVVDAANGMRIARYEGHSRAVLGIAFLEENKTVASIGVDQTVRLWNSFDGTHIRTLDNHVGTVNEIAICPIGPTAKSGMPATVATVSEDRTVRIWQPSIGRLMRFARLPSVPRTVTWSPAGDRLYLGCHDGRARILDVSTTEAVKTIDANVGRIHELAIDFEKGLMLVAGDQGYEAHQVLPKQ